MGDEYGRKEWRTDEAAATAEAVRRIEAAIASGATVLDFRDLIAMTRLPDELAKAQGVREIYAGAPRATGLAPNDYATRRLTNISALAGLTKLTSLDLSLTRVADLSALSGLSGLTSLNLSDTQVHDLFELSDLSVLTFLDLSLTRVADLSALSGLSGLRALDLSYTEVFDLSALSGLSALTSLNLSDTEVSELSALSGLSALTSLNLSDTEVSELSALSGLSGLTFLDLSETQVSDLSALFGLSGLTSLNLSNTQVSDLGFQMSFPVFASEQARELSYYNTPAANPQADRRLDLLSRLPPDRCAIETVQYLKGTHPDFGTPEVRGNGVGKPIAANLALASPIAIGRVGDQLEAINPGTPQRVNPLEAGQRVDGLRRQVALVRAEALHTQCGPAVLRRLESYAESLVADPPIFFVMDAPMQMLRGSLDDSYLMEAVDKGLEQGLRGLVDAHDALRPFLMPPSDEEVAAMDALPTPNVDVTPYDVAGLARQAVDALSGEDIRDMVGPQLVSTLKAFQDLAVTWKDRSDNPSFLRRMVAPFGGTLSVLADAISVHAWWLGPTGVSLAGRIQPLLDTVLGWFRAVGLSP
jgi:hypothetical protein